MDISKIDPKQESRIILQEEKYNLILGTMSNVSSPDLQIAFRTPGFHQYHNSDAVMWDIITRIKQHS